MAERTLTPLAAKICLPYVIGAPLSGFEPPTVQRRSSSTPLLPTCLEEHPSLMFSTVKEACAEIITHDPEHEEAKWINRMISGVRDINTERPVSSTS